MSKTLHSEQHLALFDFDGTLTHTDTYTRFVLQVAPLHGLLLAAPEDVR
ncbi:hypothetical protein [Alteromonas sp. CYL-A6]